MRYLVEFPVTGYQTFVVEAPSKEAAIEAALAGHIEDSWLDTDVQTDSNLAQVRDA